MLNVFGQSKIWFLTLVTFSTLGLAERYRGSLAVRDSSIPRNSTLKYRGKSKAPLSNVFGGLEVRPSVKTADGAFHTENSVWLGMKFPSWTLSYVQDIETYPTSNLEEGGNPYLFDGHVKARFDDIWTDGKTSFSDEVRVHAPVNSVQRDRGHITSIRNHFKITHKLSPTVTLGFQEVPIIHLYSEAGATSADGTLVANPSFENRMILGLNFALTENITLGVPLQYWITKYRYYGESATLSDEWDPLLFFWPEISWNLNGGPVTLGVGYRTNNLTKVTEDGTTSDMNGTFQAVFGVSF